jgi:hypothetical protein
MDLDDIRYHDTWFELSESYDEIAGEIEVRAVRVSPDRKGVYVFHDESPPGRIRERVAVVGPRRLIEWRLRRARIRAWTKMFDRISRTKLAGSLLNP